MNMRILIAFFIATLFSAELVYAESCAASLHSPQSLSGAAADILKQTQVDYIKRDPHDFCQRNMLLRGLNANHVAPVDVEEISTSDLKQKYAEKIQADTSWTISLIPTKESRVRAFLSGADSASAFDLGPKTVDIAKYDQQLAMFKDYFSRPEAIAQSLDCSKKQNSIPNKSGCAVFQKISLPIEATAKKAAACVEISLWHSRGCSAGLSVIEDTMTPVSRDGAVGTTYAPPKLWSEVLGNPKYDTGLRLAAMSVIDRLNGKSQEQNANIFSDLQNAFQKSGMKSDEAKDAAFNILGLIGGASSNLAARLGGLGLESQKAKALSLISGALPLLDYKKATEGNGTLYSLPASVSSKCDNAKTYHFWLAAYLSRSLVKDGKIDEVGAVDATFVAEKGYQVSRNLGRRNHDDDADSSSVIAKQPYDPVHQVQRMDLNFAAAGAEFGARSLKTTDAKLNLDQSLASMIENSKVTSPVSKEEAQSMGFVSSYLKWEKEVSPDTALTAIQKQSDDQ